MIYLDRVVLNDACFSTGRNVLTLPEVARELRDLRCCDGDAVTLECKVHAAPEEPLVRWERGGKVNININSFSSLVSFSTFKEKGKYTKSMKYVE